MNEFCDWEFRRHETEAIYMEDYGEFEEYDSLYNYITGCNNMAEILSEYDEKYKYCPYCGKEIRYGNVR